ncbi:MAG: uracil-DNA glycosylase family protein [Gaiellaceae bacterium]
METEQINIRLRSDLAAALDRATAIRRLLETSIKQWELEHALRGYQTGELSVGRAAEEAGLTQWELIDAARLAGIAHPLTAAEASERLAALTDGGERTLPDIPPAPGGVLLVGLNPPPPSVAAGHYYQGRLGQRLWRRLERVGLLENARPGAEDEAFAGAGHGLTDLVKRPTVSAAELGEAELSAGVEALRDRIRSWRPGLVLFAFREPAQRLLGRAIKPGRGPELEGVPTFLLSGPYAPRAEAERIDAELVSLLGGRKLRQTGSARTQRVTRVDLAAGRIRLPREAKRFFPSERGSMEVVLRGERLRGRYDPRTGPDKERSGVLSFGKQALARLVRPDEVLEVVRGTGGVVRLD